MRRYENGATASGGKRPDFFEVDLNFLQPSGSYAEFTFRFFQAPYVQATSQQVTLRNSKVTAIDIDYDQCAARHAARGRAAGCAHAHACALRGGALCAELGAALAPAAHGSATLRVAAAARRCAGAVWERVHAHIPSTPLPRPLSPQTRTSRGLSPTRCRGPPSPPPSA